jgi:hypothetical protein
MKNVKGGHILTHPDLVEINDMFWSGFTSVEIEAWLKSKHKDKRFHRTKYELGAYKNNFLTKASANAIKRARKALNTSDTKHEG